MIWVKGGLHAHAWGSRSALQLCFVSLVGTRRGVGFQISPTLWCGSWRLGKWQGEHLQPSHPYDGCRNRQRGDCTSVTPQLGQKWCRGTAKGCRPWARRDYGHGTVGYRCPTVETSEHEEQQEVPAWAEDDRAQRPSGPCCLCLDIIDLSVSLTQSWRNRKGMGKAFWIGQGNSAWRAFVLCHLWNEGSRKKISWVIEKSVFFAYLNLQAVRFNAWSLV